MDCKLDIIIVKYRKPGECERLLDEISKQVTDFKPTIHVQDNDLINTGYVFAVNAAARYGTGEYILLANPDIMLGDPKTLQRMIDHMDRWPLIGALGCRQVRPDGTDEAVFRPLPTFWSMLAGRLLKTKSNRNQGHWLQSSFTIYRRSMWEKVGGLDERYENFMADVDICRKLSEISIIYYEPAIKVGCDGVRASAKWGPAMRSHIKDALKYFWKWL
jgi:N-acetylglucosaminyl-diphospho-decaprenol L-rhamnosyltransferase